MRVNLKTYNSECNKTDCQLKQTFCREFIIQPNDVCTMQSVQSGNAQYNLWINAINDCMLYIDDEELFDCEFSNKNGTTTLENRATVCLNICNSVSAVSINRAGPIMIATILMMGTKYHGNLNSREDQILLQWRSK